MKCGNCPAGKKIIRNGHRCVKCIQYGMILKADHECEKEGWKEYDGGEDQGGEVFGETELFSAAGEDSGEVPGLL